MKTMQATEKDSKIKKILHAAGTVLLETETPDELCGCRQFKDGVTFTFFSPQANSVQIAGDFNNWQPQQSPLKKVRKNGLWKIKLSLNPGTYCYRLVVDGRWQQDPYNDLTQPNCYGELNSVVKVS